jgi:large subunit ribosomal protein L10
MDRETKQVTIRELQEKLGRVASVVLADYRGLNVEAVNTLRRQFENAACEYRVVKNTLLQRAIKGTKMEPLGKLLEGPTAIAFSFEDPAAPAKVAKDYGKTPGGDKFVVKGGYVDGMILDPKGVGDLASMPGKQELRAKFLATLTAVATDFVRLLAAAQQSFVFLLAARERAMKEEGGAAS